MDLKNGLQISLQNHSKYFKYIPSILFVMIFESKLSKLTLIVTFKVDVQKFFLFLETIFCSQFEDHPQKFFCFCSENFLSVAIF